MVHGDIQTLATVLQSPPRHIDPATPFTSISTDTRTLTPGSVFVALKGDRFDGHTFIPQALDQGSCLIISEHSIHGPHIQVPDTLAAYQSIARWWREQFAIPVIGITGSVGKTTTKEFLAAALNRYGPVLKSQSNHNNDIGVAQTLLHLESHHRFAVLEMAMRGPGEIARLATTAQPTHALITNIGTAHIGRLGSREAIAAAKCELLRVGSLQTAILNGEDQLLLSTARTVWTGPTVTYGLDSGMIRGDWDPQACCVYIGSCQFPIPINGRHHALNWMSVLATVQTLVPDLTSLTTAVDLPPALEGRNQLRHLPNDLQVLDETYNAAPEAMIAALQWLCQVPGARYWAILGPMRELDSFAPELYAAVGKAAATLPLHTLVLLDPEHEMQPLADAAAPIPIHWEASATELTNWLVRQVEPGDRLLFKAARAIALETVMDPFIQQWCERKKL